MTSNSVKSVSVRQKFMKNRRLKKISFALICLATILLVLYIIDIKQVFGKNEVGLWDNMPNFFRPAIVWTYLILFVTSYVLFIVTKKIQSRFDFIPTILFLLNGLVILLLLAFTVAHIVKKL